MPESFTIRSCVSSQLIKKVLLKGFAIAFLGIFILLIAGTFIPLPILQKWGWSIVLISLGLITLGLLPYRHLSRLQLEPNKLVLADSNHIDFYSKGKKILTLPLQSVAQMSYIDHPEIYGIAILLKAPPIAPIVIYQSPKELEKLRKKGQILGKVDFFFPYFNQRAYDELMDWKYGEQV